jgi:hypothetical protein
VDKIDKEAARRAVEAWEKPFHPKPRPVPKGEPKKRGRKPKESAHDEG